MTTSAVTKRLAATGLATVLTTGALVAGGAASAGAATPASAKAIGGGATFSCTLPIVGAIDVPLSLSGADLPTDLLADFEVPAGLPIVGDLQVSGLLGLLNLIPGVNQLGANLPGFDLLLGNLPLPLDNLAAPLGGLSDVAGLAGSLGSFKTPAKAGVYDVKLPSAFSMSPLANLPLPIDLLPCEIKDGQNAVVGTVKVNKQSAAMAAKAKKATIKKGKPAKVATAVVRQDGKAATGKVVALVGGKQVASKQLQGGRATLAVKKLGKGTKKIVVKYLGNASTKTAKKTVKVTVKK
ncbi:hypothetical protein G6553_11275 [Nocardioides sp. IC4_145]|uniref:Ig-like domain repeat protein n=1 Tax=Nocardioides sp. IC4_145 TaxID=2714037 RepID=UPI0014079D65|nr:Ig-like domain repeat protein [Nocardioides sp. IC4_145]NHC23749.1 hypothetical protein [Nocardioides sp. IC4_145]